MELSFLIEPLQTYSHIFLFCFRCQKKERKTM